MEEIELTSKQLQKMELKKNDLEFQVEKEGKSVKASKFRLKIKNEKARGFGVDMPSYNSFIGSCLKTIYGDKYITHKIETIEGLERYNFSDNSFSIFEGTIIILP